MELSKILSVLMLVMATTIALFATPIIGEQVVDDFNEDNASGVHFSEGHEPFSLRGTGRFLAESPRAAQTCDKYPRVCAAKGSAGPDCCKKQCVNVKTDKLNCGMCGKKCKYSEMCCKGKCVNPSFDEKHCGHCDNKCKKGSSCVYGMCSYA